LADAKRHLNITTEDDDALITDKMEAATAFVQQFVTLDFSADPVPGAIREAVRRVTASLYEEREGGALPFDNGFLTLVGPWRKWVF
jgi:hypothetical protein